MDFNIIPDTELNKSFFGATTNIDFEPQGEEYHAEWGETVTIKYTKINVYDVAKGIYIKITEW